MRHLTELGNAAPSSIVRLFEVGDDAMSFSMQYLPGGDLERIKALGWSDTKKMDVFTRIAAAVGFAHGQGIVHRDVKPANIVLDENGEPVLTDFDIADLQFAATQSMAAAGVGTPQFAAPEQLAEQTLIARPTADIYSLGKFLYFLVREEGPPLGSTEESFMPPYLLSIEDEMIRNVIAKCIRYDAAKRFQTVEEMLELLGGERKSSRRG